MHTKTDHLGSVAYVCEHVCNLSSVRIVRGAVAEAADVSRQTTGKRLVRPRRPGLRDGMRRGGVMNLAWLITHDPSP
jgi:hypothetical protein